MFPRMRLSAIAGATVGCMAISLTGVDGRSGAGSGGQQPAPVLRSGTAAVLVDVYPQRDGRIVAGLTAADFQVFEDGKPQRIESVEFVRIVPAPPDATRRDPNNTREMYALVADPRRRVFVTFLDEFHTTTTGSHLIRRPLLDLIDRTVGADDLIGVMTARIRPEDVTFGRERLAIEEQLTRHWTWGQRQRTTTDRPDPMEEALRLCYHERRTVAGGGPWLVNDGGADRPLDELLIERRREHQTLRALSDLVAHLGGLREARTVVVLVSDGWMLFRPNRALADVARDSSPTPMGGSRLPGVFGTSQIGTSASGSLYVQCAAEAARLADIDSPRDLQDIIQRANRGNVSIYPVATAGLAAFDAGMSENLTPVGPQGLTRDLSRITNRVSSLRTIAESTDGIPVVQTNDLAAGLRTIADDVSGYYLLGYTPSNTRLDGAFRRIEVKVGVPGLSVRARRGYVAPTETRVVSAPASPPAAAAGVAEALAALDAIPGEAELHAAARVGVGLLTLPEGDALLGRPVAFRGRPAPRSPLAPAASFRYARTERLRFQWSAPLTFDRLSARLLDRTGRELAGTLPMSRDDTGAPPSVWLDLNLASFARGEYVVEVTAARGNRSEQQFVAFRVVQ